MFEFVLVFTFYCQISKAVVTKHNDYSHCCHNFLLSSDMLFPEQVLGLMGGRLHGWNDMNVSTQQKSASA